MSDRKIVKVFLYFPLDRVGEAIAYRLVKDFDLTFNILHAEVSPGKHGRLTLELSGTEEGIKQGLAFLENENVQTRIFSKNIIWNDDKCVSCGACSGVCPSGALHISQKSDWMLTFDSDKCLACETCVDACPVRAIDVDVFL